MIGRQLFNSGACLKALAIDCLVCLAIFTVGNAQVAADEIKYDVLNSAGKGGVAANALEVATSQRSEIEASLRKPLVQSAPKPAVPEPLKISITIAGGVPTASVDSNSRADNTRPSPLPAAATVPILYEDFEGAFPGAWQVFDNDGATNGEVYWSDTTYRSSAGSKSVGSALGGADASSPGADYSNNMQSYMLWGPFSLSDAVGGSMTFDYWLDSEQNSDYLQWLVTIDGLNFAGYQVSGNSSGWQSGSLDFTNVGGLGNITGQSSVYVLFGFVSNGSVTAEGAYLDEVNITKITPAGVDPEIRIEPTSLDFSSVVPAASQPAGHASTADPGIDGLTAKPVVPKNLFLDVGPPDTVNLPRFAVAAQPVVVNQRALHAPVIGIELFGNSVIAVRESFESRDGQTVWVGHIEGRQNDTVIVTARGNSFSALIQQGGKTYQLGLGANGRNRLLQIDPGLFPPDDPYVLPDAGGAIDRASAYAEPADVNVVQDLLAVYTQSACDAVGSCGQMVADIVTAVADMNNAYAASGINITMNLVGTVWTDYDGSNFDIALDDITGTTDGYMDEVHGVRDQLGADLVALVFGGDNMYCGLGWLNSVESNAFSVTAANCVVGNRSFVHEIGHNQGAHHDRVTANAGNSTDYNFGYRRCNDASVDDRGSPYFRTIMAYGCTDAGRVGIFSNPDIDYLGVPQGIDPLVEPTGGAHNARRLNERATTVAGFRTAVNSKTFTIFNDGGGELSVTAIELESSAAWITWSPAAPFTLAPGGSQLVTVSVDFDLAPDGVSSNRLLVYSNDADKNPYPGAVTIGIDKTGTGCFDDGYEEDDTCPGGSLGALPASQAHLHCDVDWVRFEAQAGVSYIVETANLVGPESDTTLSIHQDCGPEIAFNDDNGFDLASRIEFTAEVDGPYDIQIRQYGESYVDGDGYDILVAEAPPVCYQLSLGFTGNGDMPVTSPLNSPNCDVGRYVSGEVVSLTANPAASWLVGSWTGTDNDASTSSSNTVTMPETDTAVTVNYVEIGGAPEIRIEPTGLNFSYALADIQQATAGAAAGSPDFSRLAARIKDTGSLRIILGLDVPGSAEGLLNARQRANQRARISTAQDDFLARIGAAAGQARKFRSIPYIALEVNSGQLARISGMPDVIHVQEDALLRPILASSNPVIGSPEAWAQGYDGSGFAVAVLDTGVDSSHPFFTTGGNKVVSEACYSTTYAPNSSSSVCPGGVASSTDPGSGGPCDFTLDEGCGHGTHVAGIAAGNDGVGPNYGVARGADIVAIQVFSRFDNAGICSPYTPPCFLSYVSDQISGLERVLELGLTIDIAAVNMSLGGNYYTDQATCDADNAAQKAAIDNLRSVGIATVVASGNEYHTDGMGSPGCISSAISVGATTDADAISSFSNVASFLDLLAPGSSITSSFPGGGTVTWNGTSMATPHVAGAWAVLKQKDPAASVDKLLEALRVTGTSVDDLRSGGSVTDMRRINVDLALDQLSIKRQTFTIFNDGTNELSVSAIDLESPASWIGWSPAAPFSVPVGSSQVVTVEVQFDAAPGGVTNNRLLIFSNDADESPYPDAVHISVENSKSDLIFNSSFE